MEPVKAPNLRLIKKAHENKWVAFSLDYKKILAAEKSLTDVRKKVGHAEAIFMRVLPANVGYAPAAHQ